MNAYASMNAGRVKRMYGSEYVSVVSRQSSEKASFPAPGDGTSALIPLFRENAN